MNAEKLEQLFLGYESASDKLDLKKIAKLYSDTFISAGPKGSIATSKKEFVEKAEDAAEFYRSVGWKSAKILHKIITPISNEYYIVKVHWGVGFEKMGDKLVEFDVSYIVQDVNDKMSIVFFITHEDEQEAMKKLGLLHEMSH